MIKITYKNKDNCTSYPFSLAKVYMAIISSVQEVIDITHLETPDKTWYNLEKVLGEDFKREKTDKLVTIVDGSIAETWENTPSLIRIESNKDAVLKFPISDKVKTLSGMTLAPTRALFLAQMSSRKYGHYVLDKDKILTANTVSGLSYDFDVFPSKEFCYINNPPILLYNMMEDTYPRMVVNSIPNKIYDEEMEKRNKPLTLKFKPASENTEFEDLLDRLYAQQSNQEPVAESALKKW